MWYSSLKWHFWLCHFLYIFLERWSQPRMHMNTLAKEKDSEQDRERQKQMTGAKDSGKQHRPQCPLQGPISHGSHFLLRLSLRHFHPPEQEFQPGASATSRYGLSNNARSESNQNPSRGHCGVRNHKEPGPGDVSPSWLLRQSNSGLYFESRARKTWRRMDSWGRDTGNTNPQLPSPHPRETSRLLASSLTTQPSEAGAVPTLQQWKEWGSENSRNLPQLPQRAMTVILWEFEPWTPVWAWAPTTAL